MAGRNNYLAEIWEAVKGTDKDFTSVSLRKALVLLSIPMVLEMMMESVFAVVDILFVSKLGSGAIAVVGITESLMTVVYAIGIGLSMGTNALVSRRFGEKEYEKASLAAVQAVWLAVLLSFPFMFTGIFYSSGLLRLMDADPHIIKEFGNYTRIMLTGNAVIMLLFVINAVFRSAGDAAIAMRILWIGNLINIFLDPCLIFGLGPFPRLGVTGAALATNIGRGIAVLFQFYYLLAGKRRIRIGMRHITFDFRVARKLLVLSAGGFIQNIIATSSWIGLMRMLSSLGSGVVAGYTIAIRVIVFSLLPSWGLSNAASTLVGQNLGAKQPERAEKSVWMAAKANMLVLLMFSLLFVALPHSFIRLFTSDLEVIHNGAVSLRLISLGFVFYGLGMVLVQAFNGAGDTMTPTWINFFCFWLLEIPLAYFLAFVAGFDERGVYLSIAISESMVAIIGFLVFRAGKWKLRQV